MKLSSEPASLTLSQEQLILREIRRPDAPPLYNECIQLRMLGPLNVTALQKGFRDIVRRHEIWRTTYSVKNQQVSQVVHPATDYVEVPFIDLDGFSSPEQEQEIDRVIGDVARRPFNLMDGPLLRTRLIRLNHLEHRLYVIAHLSIVDGLSVYQIFPNELAKLYRAYAADRSPDLHPLAIQFADYSRWQRQASRLAEIHKQLEYWRTQLAGDMPSLTWPRDHAHPPRETFRGEIEKFVLPMTLTQATKSLARREGVTLFATLISLLAALLYSYTQQDDFAIGTPSPCGRKRSEVQKLLGYFLTPVALRFRVTRSMTFRELVRHAQRLILEAISNDDLPVEVLAEKLNLKTDPSKNPLFTVAMSLQPSMPELDLQWTVTSMDISSGGAPWDLYLAFIDGPDGMLGRVQYNPDLFEAATITRMVRHYRELVQITGAKPDQRLSDIVLTTE